jgi:hypothetical protein
MMPLDYMLLTVMRDPNADNKRRDAMAMAAAPYLHPKISSVEPTPSTDPDKSKVTSIEVHFVEPNFDTSED